MLINGKSTDIRYEDLIISGTAMGLSKRKCKWSTCLNLILPLSDFAVASGYQSCYHFMETIGSKGSQPRAKACGMEVKIWEYT